MFLSSDGTGALLTPVCKLGYQALRGAAPRQVGPRFMSVERWLWIGPWIHRQLWMQGGTSIEPHVAGVDFRRQRATERANVELNNATFSFELD